MTSTIGGRIAANPYYHRRQAIERLPLLTYAPTDTTTAAVKQRADAQQAAIASQGADSIVSKLDADVLRFIYHNNMPKGSNGAITLPSLIATMQLTKTCKFFALCFRELRTDIDAPRVRRINADTEDTKGFGDDDDNLYEQRFLIAEIVGGQHYRLFNRGEKLATSSQKAPWLIIYRDLDPNSDDRYGVVCALATTCQHGFLCVSLGLSDAVRMLSGHDTKYGLFHREDHSIRVGGKSIVWPSHIDDDVETDLQEEEYTQAKLDADKVTVSLDVARRQTSVFDPLDDENPDLSCVVVRCHPTDCEPFHDQLWHLSTDSFKFVTAFFGHETESAYVARCRFGSEEEDCFTRRSHTVEYQRARSPAVGKRSCISPANVVPSNKRRLEGRLADERNHVQQTVQNEVLATGELTSFHPLYDSLLEQEVKSGQRDPRIRHESSSSGNDSDDDMEVDLEAAPSRDDGPPIVHNEDSDSDQDYEEVDSNDEDDKENVCDNAQDSSEEEEADESEEEEEEEEDESEEESDEEEEDPAPVGYAIAPTPAPAPAPAPAPPPPLSVAAEAAASAASAALAPPPPLSVAAEAAASAALGVLPQADRIDGASYLTSCAVAWLKIKYREADTITRHSQGTYVRMFKKIVTAPEFIGFPSLPDVAPTPGPSYNQFQEDFITPITAHVSRAQVRNYTVSFTQGLYKFFPADRSVPQATPEDFGFASL